MIFKKSFNLLYSQRFFVSVAVSVGLLSGCANSGIGLPGQANSPLDQANASFNQTVAEGALGGAALGALAGGLLGGSPKAAILGALAGGVLGGGTGVAVANNNQNQANTETSLQQQIAAAQRQTDEANQAAQYDDAQAAAAQQTADQLDAAYRAGSITADAYRAKMATYQQDHDQTQTLIAHLQASERRLRAQARAGGPDSGALYREANAQAATQRRLQQSYDQLSATLATVPQG
ncbi:MAG: hypothetical protein PHT60_11575 [Acidiphilium sp.]|nr:hypothetical protein [Acidiphilium sp.]MDD4936403.1 hypothetical protein [Acidiphilium sp.]